MKRARTVAVAVGFVVVSALASRASAQTGFSLDRFDPAPAGDPFFGVSSPAVVGETRVSAIGMVDYAHAPLVLRSNSPSEGTEVGRLVANQLYLRLGASLALFHRLLLSVDVPFAVVNEGTDVSARGTTLAAPTGAALGDIRFGARLRVLGESRDPFQVAVEGSLWAPTGKQESFSGDGMARGMPALVFGGRISALQWSAKAGYMFRRKVTQGASVRLDAGSGAWASDEFVFGAAAGVVLADEKLLLGPELYGSTELGNGTTFAKRTTSAELLFGVKFRPNPFVIGVAAGPGLTIGVGTPDVRVVGLIGYAPWDPIEPKVEKPLDSDLDGIIDREDACPSVPGVPNSNPKLNGCPKPTDRDGDGIIDTMDACPDVAGPKNEDPKKNGCPPDKDGDGIADVVDACPDVPGVKDEDPKKNGCPPDKDGDGIADKDDACPEVPGVKNEDPKKNGCPPDRDGDGIADKDDACPDEAGPANADPKQNGCPIKVQITKKAIVILEQVHFEFNKATIMTDSDVLLGQIAQAFKDHPEIKKVSIEGHTDNVGNAFYNQQLSQKRADAVVGWLVEHGVDKNRLESKGLGMSKPIADNKTDAGREKNRRVEFKIVDPKAGLPDVKEATP